MPALPTTATTATIPRTGAAAGPTLATHTGPAHTGGRRLAPGRPPARVTRRSFLPRMALLAGGGVLTGACGTATGSTPADPPNAAGQPATIHYFSWGTQPRFEAEQKSLAELQKDQPRITVEFEGVAFGEFHPKLRTMLAAGTPPDVTRVGQQDAPAFFAAGDLLALDDLMRRDRLDLAKTQVPPFEGSMHKGRYYGVPRGGAGNHAIVYNRTYFRQKGIPEPAEKWTWDDFIALGKRLTSEPNQVWAWNAAAFRNQNLWWSWLWSGGADYLSADGTRCTLDTPDAIAAVQWMADAQNRHGISPRPGTAPSPFTFNAQSLVMSQTGPYAIVDFEKSIGTTFDWAAVAVPRGKAGQIMSSAPNTVSITKTSKYPEQGWAMLKFFIADRIQQLEDQLGLWQPTSKALLGAPAYLTRKTPPYDMRPFVPGLQGTTRAATYVPQSAALLRDVVFKEMARAIDGQQPARDVLPDITKQANELLRQSPK